jgi:hypothetical protein
MDTNFYLPILKSKLGEFTALSKLNHAAKKKIVPLFEVTPLEWDHSELEIPKTLEDHLISFCKKFVSKWPSDNCFIDVHLLNWEGVDNTHRIEFIYDILISEGYCPPPVVRINSSQIFFEALEKTFDLLGLPEIGFRVDLNNVTSPDFENEIINILNKVSLKPSETHLILDLKDSDFSDIENFSEGLVDLLQTFPFLSEWKTFTIAGTAFPESSKIKSGLLEFDRNDWKLYHVLAKKLKHREIDRQINYGDYSIVNPKYFEFNPKTMNSSANIRYTHNKTWVVAKGKALKESKDYLQYKRLAKQIYDTKYLGEGSSAGSQHLAKCVRGEVKPGSPNVWMWVGNNHHFTKVLFDLFSILPDSLDISR